MKVKCIDNSGNFFINYGVVYEAEWYGCDMFRVDILNNTSNIYPKSLFEIIPEPKEAGMMKVTLDLPEIEGFEIAEGKQPRSPKGGEDYTTAGGGHFIAACGIKTKYIILKKKAPEYQTTSIFESSMKFVEIKALEDLMGIYRECSFTLKQDHIVVINNIKELLK